MPDIIYTGPADTRRIDSRAWNQVGVDDQTVVVWNRDNDFTATVSDKAAEWALSQPTFELFEEPQPDDTNSE